MYNKTAFAKVQNIIIINFVFIIIKIKTKLIIIIITLIFAVCKFGAWKGRVVTVMARLPSHTGGFF